MKRYGLLTIIPLLLCSCSYDLLEKTIYIPDDEDRNLPAYTEWGYNSFGVKYERSYFCASNAIVPYKMVYQSGMLNFSLKGRVSQEYYSIRYRDGEEMTLVFSFPSVPIDKYQDLTVLHKKELDLTDASCKVIMTRETQTDTLSLLSGRLTFNRAQLLRIDEKENRVILSGTFEARFIRDDQPETMSNGRFDLGINEVYVLPE